MVALGGGPARVLRDLLGLGVTRAAGGGFPWGTLLINVAGSFIIGWLATGARPDAVTMRLLLMVGFCGGFTTFSSFSLQTLELLQQGAWIAAWGNVLGSVTLCLAATSAGWTIGRGFSAIR